MTKLGVDSKASVWFTMVQRPNLSNIFDMCRVLSLPLSPTRVPPTYSPQNVPLISPCPNLHPLSGIVPQYRNTDTTSRAYILPAQGWQIGFISLASSNRLVKAARIVGLEKKPPVRPKKKMYCDQSVLSAADFGGRVAPCMLYICQLGFDSTCQESNLIKLPKASVCVNL